MGLKVFVLRVKSGQISSVRDIGNTGRAMCWSKRRVLTII